MKQKNRNMTKALFTTVMTMAMLMIAASVTGLTAFADNQYVTDHIDAPENLRFEGPYVCWDGSKYEYTYGEEEYDFHSNHDPGLGDEVRYAVEVYKVSPVSDPELLKTVDLEETRYDLTDDIEKIQLLDELGRETGNKLQVCIKAHLTSNEGPSLESAGTSVIESVPCYITYVVNKNNNNEVDSFSDYAFEGGTVTEPADPKIEGKAFLYWGDSKENRWDFSRKISTDDFSPQHTLMLYAKWEAIGDHEHDGIVFLPWRSRNSLPNEAGNYYLLNDVDISDTWNAPQGNTNLCLNGHTVSCPGGYGRESAIEVKGGATLGIYDGSDGKKGKLMMCNGASAVDVIGGTFTLNDATIDGTDREQTDYGGGVEILGGTFEMRSGKISNCRAGYGGGGICVDGGVFRMKGGEISSNRGGPAGGGVDLRNGKIEIIEGTITGNAASDNGGGIEFYPVDDNNSSITFAAESAGEHKINITGNSGGNLCLLNGYKANINGALSDDSRIGVSMYRPAEYVFTAGLTGKGTIDNFISDHDGYKITLTENGEEARLAKNPHQITAAAIEHGSLKAYSGSTEITDAIAGETVNLEPQADTGYSFVSGSYKCTYTDAEGNEVIVPVDRYGDFTMPAYDVTVSCEFKETGIEDARIITFDTDGHEINQKEIEMGQTIQLKLVPYPETAEVRSVEWESNDDGSFLTMTEDGKITGVIRDNVDDVKTVTITATAKGKNGETVTRSRDITVEHTHHWINRMGAFEATCTRAGNSAPAAICENEFYPCYKTIPENVVVTPPLGHDWDAWTSLDGERHKRVCKRQNCSETETAEHSWDEGVETTPATYTAEGVMTYKCPACGAEKTEPIPKKTYAPGEDPAQKAKDGTPTGAGASEACADKAIRSSASDEGPKGTKYGLLSLRSVKQGKTSIILTWNKNSKAVRYAVYGNLCGKNNKMKLLSKSVKTNSFSVRKINKALAKGKYYKFIVVALDENNNVVSTSKVAYVATKGGKVGNHKSVTTKAKKNKVTVKKGKTFKLAGKAVAKSKKLKVVKHRAIKYETSNAKIATVSSKGVIKGKAKGSCYIYAYAQNGVYKKIRVLVR